MEREPNGFIFRDSGDLPGGRNAGRRVVDATRLEAVDRLQAELDDGTRYDLARQYVASIDFDHVRVEFVWRTYAD